MAKKLQINCATCDARNVSEEILAVYDSITINCAEILVTSETKNLLNRYGVALNCADVLEVEKDVRLQKINGKLQLRSTDAVSGKTYLSVNGQLDIGPGTQEVLKQYEGIRVNGKVLCPESVSGCLGRMHVSGKTVIYPDDAIVLKKDAVIDRTFVLRAKEKLYWSEKRIIFVDPRLDAGRLAAKGAAFSAEEVILAESMVEELIGLIDEKADVIIVPDGTSVITDDVELGEFTVKKYGTKLYILGDVTVDPDAADVLEKLEYLNIRGDAAVDEELKNRLAEAITEISGEIQVRRTFKGRTLEDKVKLRISKWLLEQEALGIRVRDCAEVILDEDIPKELILERLTICDCVKVVCTQEQEPAVSAIAEDVVCIGNAGGVEVGDEDGGILKCMTEGFAGKDDTKTINAADYVL